MSQYQRMSGFGRFSIFPPVIKALIIINVVVFVVQHLFLPNMSVGGTPLIEYFIAYFYLFPVDSGYFNIWQIFTYQFIHSGFWHILMNLFVLWMFGAEIEALWGPRKFLVFYLLSGVGAALFQLFLAPLLASTGPTIGASGSVYGVLLAFALTYPNRPIYLFPFFIPIPAKFFALFYVGISLIMGLSSNDTIAHFAHLGGAVTGWFLLKYGDKIGLFNFFENLFGKSGSSTAGKRTYQTKFHDFSSHEEEKEPRVFNINWQKKSEPLIHEDTKKSTLNVNGEEITQAKIDEILDKISANGYQNLTEREKQILFELSQKLK